MRLNPLTKTSRWETPIEMITTIVKVDAMIEDDSKTIEEAKELSDA